MQKYLATLARILLAQLFLVQVIVLIIGFTSNPDGYQQYQASLVNTIGGLALLLGYKTKAFALVMAIYIVGLTLLLKLPLLQYLAIAGGLLLLYANPNTACSLDNLKKKA
jgi:putative oxidoreductase